MILDANALSGLLREDATLIRVLAGVPQLQLPVIVIGEFRFGIAQSKYRREYERWLERDINRFEILNIVNETTQHYASIRLELKRQGTPIPANDTWIAALSFQHGVEIVSRDTHFDAIPRLRRIDW